jgi:hypothetical protein
MQRNSSVLIALAVLIGFGCHQKASEVHAASVIAVTGGAVAVIGVENGHFIALERFGPQGTVIFRQRLACENAASIVADNERVFTYCVVGVKVPVERVAAYSLATGEELWHHDEKTDADPSTSRLRLVGDAVVSEGKALLTVFSSTGEVRAKHATSAQLRAPLVNNNRLTYFTRNTVLSVDTVSGAVTESPSRLLGCVVDGKFWEAVDGRVTSRLASELDAPKTDVPLEIANLFEIRGCGRHGKALVFEVAVGGSHVAHHHLVKTSDGHSIDYEVDLGPAELETQLASERPDVVELNGDVLPRFHFAFLSSNQAGQLASFDLETGAIKAIGEPRSAEDVINISLFRDQKSWWMVDGTALHQFSANTGESTGDGELAPDSLDLSPATVFNDQVWIGSGTWQVGHSKVWKVDVKSPPQTAKAF